MKIRKQSKDRRLILRDNLDKLFKSKIDFSKYFAKPDLTGELFGRSLGRVFLS